MSLPPLRPAFFRTLALLGLLGLGLGHQAAEAASSAVIVMYHRFGEDSFPSTNIRLEQFEAHLEELTSGDYNVLPVAEIIERLKNGKELPERTVGITIDDAYQSIYTEAWPRLKEAGLPFTVFVSTAHVDHGTSRHLNWDQVREMREDGVDFGHHTVSHMHIPEKTRADLDREITVANQRFEKELGVRPTLFGYPYGETNAAAMALVEQSGYAAAFGQHSGVVDRDGDYFYLPRFSLNEKFGGIDRFRMIVNALSLPVQDMTPADPEIGADNPPAIGFTVARDVGDLGRMACFLSHEGKRAEMAVLGPRIEIRARHPLPDGRTRLNCTLPAEQGRWRWFGYQFVRTN